MDTIKFRVVGRINENPPAGWTLRREKVKRSEKGEEWGPIRLTHETSVRIWSYSYDCSFVEVELPKLIYPTNGYLIKDQAELAQATARLLELLAEAFVFLPEQSFELTRIDFVTHVPVEPKVFISAYRYFRLPRITSPTSPPLTSPFSRTVSSKMWARSAPVRVHESINNSIRGVVEEAR